MEFKRTNSSRIAPPSARSVPPLPPSSSTPQRKRSIPVNTPTPRRSSTPRDHSSSGLSASLPPRPNGGVCSARGSTTPPGLPRPDGFKRCTTNTSVNGTSNGTSNSNINVLNGGGGVGVTGAVRQFTGKTGGNGRVNVYARVRAFNENETADDQRQLAVNMKDETVEVQVPKKGCFTFTFDGVFWCNQNASEKPFSSQEDVFDIIGRPLVENAMAGYNAAVMFYGQTGSGKTHTAFGPPKALGTPEEGLIPRVCKMIFDRAAGSSQKGITYRITASMLEVYLEGTFDLFNHRKEVTIRNDYRDNSFHVVGLKSIPVRSYEEVAALLQKAEPLRTFAATAIHSRSSRAHTLFQLEVQTIFDSVDVVPRTSKILLADLAGCERIKIAQTESGTPFEQARNINLSLLALGSCIEAVATRKGFNQTIPEFRNSTLTKLLKEYLGGNSVSAIVVTIAPSARDAHLSVQSLRFADRAKQITTHAKINTVKMVDTIDDGADKLTEELRDAYLKKKEALYAEYQLQNTIQQLLTKIEILEAQLMDASDKDCAQRIQEEIERLQKDLSAADVHLLEQRRVIYMNEVVLEEELKELNTKMQELKEEHEEAIETLMTEDFHKYNEEMKAKQHQHEAKVSAILAEHQDEMAKIRQELHEANVTITQRDTSIEELLQEIRKLKETIEELSTPLKNKEEENESLKALLAERDGAIQELMKSHLNDKETAEAQQSALQNQLNEAFDTIKDLHTTHNKNIQVMDSKQADLQNQIANLEEKIHTAEEQIEETRQALKDEQELHASDCQAAEEKQTEQQAAIEGLESQLEETRQALSELKDKYERCDGAAAALEAELVGRIGHLTSELERLETDLNEKQITYESAVTDLEEAVRVLEAELVERTGQLEDAQQALCHEQERLAETTQAAEEKESAMQSQIEGLQEDLATAGEQLEEAQNVINDLQYRHANDMQAAERKAEELQSVIENLEEELKKTETQMQEEIGAYEEEMDSWRNKMDAEQRFNEERVVDFESRINNLKLDLEGSTGHAKALVQYITNLEEYVRRAFSTTVDGFTELRAAALEDMSMLTIANMFSYANMCRAHEQLERALESLQVDLDDARASAKNKSTKLRNVMDAAKMESDKFRACVVAMMQIGQNALAKTVKDTAGSPQVWPRGESPEPRQCVPAPLTDWSNKENDAKRSMSNPLTSNVKHLVASGNGNRTM